MFLDPEGIPRSSRWAGDLEPAIGRPSWGRICEFLADLVDPEQVRAALRRDATSMARLPETMRECGVEDAVIERIAPRCEEIAADLREIRG